MPHHNAIRLKRACAWPNSCRDSATGSSLCAWDSRVCAEPATSPASRHLRCNQGCRHQTCIVPQRQDIQECSREYTMLRNRDMLHTGTKDKHGPKHIAMAARAEAPIHNTLPIHCQSDANVTIPPVDYVTPGAFSPSPLPTRWTGTMRRGQAAHAHMQPIYGPKHHKCRRQRTTPCILQCHVIRED